MIKNDMLKKLIKRSKKIAYRCLIFSMAFLIIIESLPLGLLPGQLLPKAVGASTSITKTLQTDWMAGKYEYGEIDVATSSGDLKLQLDLGTWDATGPASLNHYPYVRNKMLMVNKFLYVFRNRAIGQFLRYDFDTREYKELSYMPLDPYEIADMTTNGTDTIWVFANRTSTTNLSRYFLKYDIPTDTWSYLSATPAYMAAYARLEYVDSNTIYAIRGGGYYDLWRYTISTDSWDVIQNTTAYCQTYCDLVFDGNQYIYFSTDWGAPDRLYRFDINTRGWSQRANLPLDGSLSTATDMVMLGDDIYTMRGASTKTFYKYNTVSNTWTTVKDLPYLTYYGALAYDSDNNRIITQIGVSEFIYYYPTDNNWSNSLTAPLSNAFGTGNSMESDGAGNLYLCRGQSTTTCYKYTIATDTWTAIGAISGTTLGANGTSLAFYNNALYVNRGSSGNNIYRYNVATNDWTTAGLNSPAATLGDGANMVASSSGTLWALQGGGGTGFYSYNVAGNAWTTKTVVPEGTYRGSGMVQAGMYTYVMQGWTRGRFWRYHETTNGWSELASLPVGTYYGGGLTYDGVEYIYAQVGGENDIWGRQFYRYSITNNSWQRLADTPAMIRWGGDLAFYDTKIYSYQGYDGGFWKYTPPTAVYKTSGTWYSPVYDLTYSTEFNSFTSTQTTPSGTSVAYYSRTSDNQNTWSDWEIITDGSIISDPKRYIQIKAVLTGDGTNSPTLSDFTIDYDSDVTAPVTSSFTVSGYSASGGTALTSGQSYSHRNPYFTFTGATDVQSGIDGYYVYFGSNASADPETLGVYQYATNYTVATSMINGTTYYLLIKVKDKLGNKSEAVTGFTYIYNGISPATTTSLITNQADWDNNEATKSSVYVGSSGWWNQSYLYRKQLTISPAAYLGPNSIIKLTLDTAALVTDVKLRSDRKDWRIVYWDGNNWKEIDRDYVDATTTYFALQKGIAAAATDTNYYAYYGNANESTTALSDISQIGGAKWGGGTSHDGGDYVRIPSAINNQSALTLEGWFKLNNNNGGRYVYGNSGTQQVAIGIGSQTYLMNYYFKTSGTTLGPVAGTTYVEPGSWHHFALTYDSATSTLKAYLDGRLDYSNAAVTGNVSVSVQQYIGYSNSGYFYGYLDEYRISNNVRYTTDFTVPTSKFSTDANTLALYHFDDNTGQTLTDSSANGNNGTLGSAAGVDAADPTWVAVTTATSDTEENVPASASDNDLKLESMNGGSWAGYQVSTMPWGLRMYYGASVYASGLLYVLRGYNTKTFYKLDPATGVWTQLADTPGNMYNGTSMVFDGTGNIYATQGQGYNLYKYNIATNTWTSTLTASTVLFSTGATLIMVGTNTIYALAGASTSFLKYTISTDGWENVSGIPYSTSAGAGLYYDGTNTIWAVAGAGSGFAKYIINTDTWDSTLPLAPYSLGTAANNLVYYNNYLYAFSSYDYQSNSENKRFVWRYSMSSNKWESITVSTEFWTSAGAVAYDGSRYIYLFQGYNTSGTGATAVTRFDLTSHKYLPETPVLSLDRTYQSDSETILHQPYTGSSLAFDGSDNIYFAQGATTYLNKYQVSTKKWSMIPYIPCYYYGGITYASGHLYAVCGNTTKLMFRYDPETLNWTKMADAPDTIGAGGNQIAVFDGADSIYVLRGRGTRTLYKYSILNNTWTTESDQGSAPPDTIGNGWGASMTYDGTGNLYVFRGNDTASFYKYNIGGSWSTLNSPPELVSYGSGSVYDNGKIYLLSGDFNNSFYIYDVTNNVWSIGTKTMSSHNYAGGALVKGPGNSLYALQGNYSFTFWKYNIPTSSTSYKATGSYISKSFDLGTVYGWAGLSATVASPSATAVTFETRTSTDSANWSSWTEATDLKKLPSNQFTYNINSSVNRYFQVKATLTSDESAETPTISDISATYYKDETGPINPDTLSSYETSTKAADQALTDNKWYNKASPYFEWTGATDSLGSGIAGYYVYFNQDENADASTSGTFQTGANYTASLSQDGEYFLKIKAKDNAGNISSTNWSAFHYRYDGTAPNDVGTVSVDPRIYTTTNSFNMSWTAVTDQTSNATSSGLLGYYYQATDSASLVGDSFSSTGSVIGTTAYKTGENTFRVKAIDNAGNETGYTTATFYYNSEAPSAPTELAVDISQAGANKFAFTWSKPTVYLKGAVKEYHYSINALPDATNISTTSGTMISNQKGTQSGTNTFYVVAVDEAGNVDYDNYASVDFDVNITAPGIPLNPETFDNSIRNTESYRVGITWDKPTDLGSAFDRYEVYASTTNTECSTSMTSYSLVGTTAGTSDGGSYVVTSMNNAALESTTYYFCVLACSSSNQCSGSSTTVDMLPTGRWLVAPVLTVDPAITILTKTATVTWSTSREANSFVKYGTGSGSYGNEVGSST